MFKQHEDFNKSLIGKDVKVLVEGIGNKPGQVKGRTEHFQSTYLNADASIIGQIVTATVEFAKYNSLFANLKADARV